MKRHFTALFLLIVAAGCATPVKPAAVDPTPEPETKLEVTEPVLANPQKLVSDFVTEYVNKYVKVDATYLGIVSPDKSGYDHSEVTLVAAGGKVPLKGDTFYCLASNEQCSQFVEFEVGTPVSTTGWVLPAKYTITDARSGLRKDVYYLLIHELVPQ